MRVCSSLIALSLLAGCTGASTQPSPAPVPSGAGTPSASSQVSPSPVANLKLLAPYDFVQPASVAYDPGLQEVYVFDALGASQTEQLRGLRFAADGSFKAELDLRFSNSSERPKFVPAAAFDLRSVGYVAHCTDDQFRLGRMLAGNIVQASDMPVTAAIKPLKAAMSQDDAGVLTLALLKRVKTDSQDREIVYAQAAPSEIPKAIFSLPDPLAPTAVMAAAPDGRVVLFGPDSQGKQAPTLLSPDRSLTPLPLTLSAVPAAAVFDGHLISMLYSGQTTPATLRKFDPATQRTETLTLKTSDGVFIERVISAVDDHQGGLVVLGRIWDAQGRIRDGVAHLVP